MKLKFLFWTWNFYSPVCSHRLVRVDMPTVFSSDYLLHEAWMSSWIRGSFSFSFSLFCTFWVGFVRDGFPKIFTFFSSEEKASWILIGVFLCESWLILPFHDVFCYSDQKLLGGMQNMLKYMSTLGRSMRLHNALEIWISNWNLWRYVSSYPLRMCISVLAYTEL